MIVWLRAECTRATLIGRECEWTESFHVARCACLCSWRNKIMNYDISGGARSLFLSRPPTARERDAGRRGVAPTSEGLLYMNYDDAATPSAVISLWICWTLLAHWLKTHPPFVRERLRWPFLFLYWHSVMHIASGDAQTVIFRHGTEISRANERSRRTFGMQIRWLSYVNELMLLMRYRRPLWGPLRRFLHYINLHFSRVDYQAANVTYLLFDPWPFCNVDVE